MIGKRILVVVPLMIGGVAAQGVNGFFVGGYTGIKVQKANDTCIIKKVSVSGKVKDSDLFDNIQGKVWTNLENGLYVPGQKWEQEIQDGDVDDQVIRDSGVEKLQARFHELYAKFQTSFGPEFVLNDEPSVEYYKDKKTIIVKPISMSPKDNPDCLLQLTNQVDREFIEEVSNPRDLMFYFDLTLLSQASTYPLLDNSFKKDYIENIPSQMELRASRKTREIYGLSAGYHRSFFRECSGIGLYLGGEVFFEYSPGKNNISLYNGMVQKSSIHSFANRSFVYDQELPTLDHSLSVQGKFAYGGTLMLGLITKNNWMVYIPFCMQVCKYNAKLNLSSNIALYNNVASYMLTDSGKLENMTFSCPDSRNDRFNASFKKTKFQVGYGIGVSFKLSENLVLGARYLYMLNSKLNFSTKPYADSKYGASHDMTRFGTDHSIKVGSHKFYLGISYNFS